MENALKGLQYFALQGAVDSIAPFGLGHINDSFLVQAEGKSYLLQRLNTSVFKTPQVIEGNLRALLAHAPELFAKHLRGTGGNYHEFDGEHWWRLQEFVPNSYSPNELQPNELREVSTGFGCFTAQFGSQPLEKYTESIPHFHDLHLRLRQLQAALEANAAGRLESVLAEVGQVQQFNWIAARFDKLVDEGLPLRICHNDAKAGNCLLSKPDSRFLKVVDLDTVGPGYALFDLGDMLRSMLFNVPENRENLESLSFSKERFHAIVNPFVEACSGVLKPIEIESLPFGGLYMTYIMAVRFLTDYLNGDIYYKVSHEKENLSRARNQLTILELMASSMA